MMFADAALGYVWKAVAEFLRSAPAPVVFVVLGIAMLVLVAGIHYKSGFVGFAGGKPMRGILMCVGLGLLLTGIIGLLPGPGQEPHAPRFESRSETRRQPVSISRAHMNAGPGNVDCPNCKQQFYADFDVPDGGVFQDVAASSWSCSGTPQVWHCPDGGKCSAVSYTFSDPADGSKPCRKRCRFSVLARNYHDPHSHSFTLDYAVTTRVCVANCRLVGGTEKEEMAVWRREHDVWEARAKGMGGLVGLWRRLLSWRAA